MMTLINMIKMGGLGTKYNQNDNILVSGETIGIERRIDRIRPT